MWQLLLEEEKNTIDIGNTKPYLIALPKTKSVKKDVKTSSQGSEDTHFTEYARFEKVWAG